MQKTLTIRGKRFSTKKIYSLIDEQNRVVLNDRLFNVTYKLDEYSFEDVKKEKAKYFLLWGQGYKYALSFLIPQKEE